MDNDKVKAFNIRIPERLHEWLKREAESRDISINKLVKHILAEQLHKHKED